MSSFSNFIASIALSVTCRPGVPADGSEEDWDNGFARISSILGFRSCKNDIAASSVGLPDPPASEVSSDITPSVKWSLLLGIMIDSWSPLMGGCAESKDAENFCISALRAAWCPMGMARKWVSRGFEVGGVSADSVGLVPFLSRPLQDPPLEFPRPLVVEELERIAESKRL